MCQINSPSFMSYSGPSDNSKFSGSALLADIIQTYWCYIFNTKSNKNLLGMFRIYHRKTRFLWPFWFCVDMLFENRILGPDAVYEDYSFGASSSRTIVRLHLYLSKQYFVALLQYPMHGLFDLNFLELIHHQWIVVWLCHLDLVLILRSPSEWHIIYTRDRIYFGCRPKITGGWGPSPHRIPVVCPPPL